MRMTLLTSAAILGFALSLPAFAQTATDPTPANPSAVKDGTPAAGTGSGAAPGNDPATSGKTGATLGAQAPQQDPGPLGATTNPAPEGNTGTPPASATGMGTSGNGADQNTPTATAPNSSMANHPRHRRMSSSSSSMGNGNSGDEGGSTGRWAHQPGSGMSGPASAQASNIDSADTHSMIAPHLPQPQIGMNAGPDGYLRAADRALAAHKTGAAQQALEMAETRLLDRSTSAATANQPDPSPRIAAVSAARKALAAKDWKGARASIQEAMNTGSGGGMSSGGAGGDSGSPMPAGPSSGGMQNGMSNSSGAMGAGTVSPTPNPGNSSPPVNPTGAGPDGTHAIGTGNGGGALGTTTNDSAGGAK